MVYVLTGSNDALAKFWLNKTQYESIFAAGSKGISEYLPILKGDLQRAPVAVTNSDEAYAYLDAVMRPVVLYMISYLVTHKPEWQGHQTGLRDFFLRILRYYFLNEIAVKLKEKGLVQKYGNIDHSFVRAFANPIAFLEKCLEKTSDGISGLKAIQLEALCDILSEIHAQDNTKFSADVNFGEFFSKTGLDYAQGDLSATLFATPNMFCMKECFADYVSNSQLFAEDRKDDYQYAIAFSQRFKEARVSYMTNQGLAAGFSMLYDEENKRPVLMSCVINPLLPRSQQTMYLVLNNDYFRLTEAFKRAITFSGLSLSSPRLKNVWSWERMIRHSALAVIPQKSFNDARHEECEFGSLASSACIIYGHAGNEQAGLNEEGGYPAYDALAVIAKEDNEKNQVVDWCINHRVALHKDAEFNEKLRVLVGYLSSVVLDKPGQLDLVFSYLKRLRKNIERDIEDHSVAEVALGFRDLAFGLVDVAAYLQDPQWWDAVMPVAVAGGSPAFTDKVLSAKRQELIGCGGCIMSKLDACFKDMPSIKTDRACVLS